MAGINELLAQIEDLSRANELTEESLRGLLESSDNASDGLQKFENVAVAAATGVNDFGKQIASGNDKMTAMNGAIGGLANAIGSVMDEFGPLGKVAGVITKGLGKAVTFAIDRLQASHDAFQSLADAGAIGAEGITGLRDDMYAARIPLETYSAMLKKNSEDLSFIFGSALKGSSKFADTMTVLNDESHNTLRFLGFSIEEIGDTLVKFQKTSERYGFQQEMSANKLAKASEAYGIELDLLSKLTGKNKETLQNERDSRLLDGRYRAYLATLTKEQAAEMEKYIATVAKLGPEHEKQAMATVAGLITTADGQKAALSGASQEYSKMAQIIESNNGSMEKYVEGTKKVAEVNGKFFKQMNGYFLAAGDDAGYFTTVAGLRDSEIIGRKMSVEEMKKAIFAQFKQTEETDKLTKTTTMAQKTMQGAISTLDKAILDLVPADMVVRKFAEGLKAATNKIRELLGISTGGVDMSEAGGNEDHEDAIRDFNKATAKLEDTRQKLKEAYKTDDDDVIKKYELKVANLQEEVKNNRDNLDYYKSDRGKQEKQQVALEKLLKEKEILKFKLKDNTQTKKRSQYQYSDQMSLDFAKRQKELRDKIEQKDNAIKLNKEDQRKLQMKTAIPLNRNGKPKDPNADLKEFLINKFKASEGNSNSDEYIAGAVERKIQKMSPEELKANTEEATRQKQLAKEKAEEAKLSREDHKKQLANFKFEEQVQSRKEELLKSEKFLANFKKSEADEYARMDIADKLKSLQDKAGVDPVSPKEEKPITLEKVQAVVGNLPKNNQILPKPSDKEFEVKSTAVSEEKALQWELEMLKEAAEAKKQNSAMVDELKDSNNKLTALVTQMVETNKIGRDQIDATNSQTIQLGNS